MGPCSAIYHAFAGYLIYYGAQIYPSEKVAGYSLTSPSPSTVQACKVLSESGSSLFFSKKNYDITPSNYVLKTLQVNWRKKKK